MKSLPVGVALAFAFAFANGCGGRPAPTVVEGPISSAVAVPSAPLAAHAEPAPPCVETPALQVAALAAIGTCDPEALEGAAAAPLEAALLKARGRFSGTAVDTRVTQACHANVFATVRVDTDSMPGGEVQSDVWVGSAGKYARIEDANLLGSYDFDGDGKSEAFVLQDLPEDAAALGLKTTRASVYFADHTVTQTLTLPMTDTLEVFAEGAKTVLVQRHGQSGLEAGFYAPQDLTIYAFSPTGPEAPRLPLPKTKLHALVEHCVAYAEPLPKMMEAESFPTTPAATFVESLAPKCAPLADAEKRASMLEIQTKLAPLFRARGVAHMPEVTVHFGCALPSGTLMDVRYVEDDMLDTSELWHRAPDGTTVSVSSLRGLVGSEWYEAYGFRVLGNFDPKGDGTLAPLDPTQSGRRTAPLIAVTKHEVGSMTTASRYALWVGRSSAPVFLGSAMTNVAAVARPQGDLLLVLPVKPREEWSTTVDEATKLPWTEKTLAVLTPKKSALDAKTKATLKALIAETAKARAALPKP